MPESAFEIIGPPMIGPSSSHTAGAVRIGLAAHFLFGGSPALATIGLHGSFAATGKGHATDRGIVAGLLGFGPDDERLKDSLQLAEQLKLSVEFADINLGEQAHPNSARLELEDQEHSRRLTMVASSVGGGSIEIVSVDGFNTLFTGTFNTLVIWHQDRAGFLAHVTAIFACVNANIATIRTTRQHRASSALTVIELDNPPLPEVTALLQRVDHVEKLREVPPLT